MSLVVPKPQTFKNISNRFRVSHEGLVSIFSALRLEVAHDLCMSSDDGVLTELRAFLVMSIANPMRTYLVAFAFSKEKANRLCLIDEEVSKNIVDWLARSELLTPLSRQPWIGTTLILVGKAGSKELTKFATLWNRHKVIHMDFPNGTSVEDFVTIILSDIDKIERSRGVLNNTDEIDLSSLPLSDKRVRLSDDMSETVREETVFANQLLQIPGISERVAQSIAHRFQRPATLITHLESPDALGEFTFTSAKGETKKLNVRIKNTLYRLCSQGVMHDELIR